MKLKGKIIFIINKKLFKWLSFTFLTIIGLNSKVLAQKLEKPIEFGFKMKGKRQKEAKIPFDIYANLIVLKLSIDNKDTLNFILDTGVSSFIITDPKLSEKLGVKVARQVKIKGAGEKEFITADVSMNHNVNLGFLTYKNASLVLLRDDILKLSEYMGIPIHGIFGHELFDRFVININFAAKTLRIYEPSFYKEKWTKGEKYPLTVTASKPFIDIAKVYQNDNEAVPLRLVIDTGAGHALMLDAQQENNIKIPDKTIRANLGRGLNGLINGHIGRIKKLSLGDLVFTDVLATFPDSSSYGLKFDQTDKMSRQGSIGGEILRRFSLTFNYSKNYVAFKPLKAKYNAPFEHDMSGMEVKAIEGEKGNFKEFIIHYVSPNSQADLAGVLEGDQIIFINNTNYKELTIDQIYNYLSKKEGYPIELFIKRNKEIIFINFKLKRVI